MTRHTVRLILAPSESADVVTTSIRTKMLCYSTITREELLNTIESKWKDAEERPNIFRYRLQVQGERRLTGSFGFLLQVSPNPIQILRTFLQ